ncbi:TerC/Alx family metal homeostasis membrane protein [Conexibacter sp. SYSU D00693]|uniref:TerC/Alx family metal homeostasis membrane protein n=1 Tax=Conexibacter sp. SYSU D00693 TaxID=2812560 RepID=UPI00196B373D|nr:TerC/Alx family metal homeostasis membrane protein [Conexibacter sp. SYSU D00693]
MTPIANVTSPFALGGLVFVVILLLLVDLLFFARGRHPSFREAAIWSVGWLVLSLLMAFVVLALDDSSGAVEYTTVYLIERTLSLDNLFVFLLLFGYFAVPEEHRTKLLFWGIVLALVLRGLAILVGVELIDRFHWVLYVLGATLLVLAYRMLRGGHEDVDPEKNLVVRLTKRVFPVTTTHAGGSFFVHEDGKRKATPVFLAFVSLGAADIAFAVDSIPAAFAISEDAFVIWTANAFALMGLRALFVLVEELIKRFRYLDATLAIVLALVGLKILLEDVIHLSPAASLAMVAVCFAAGISASLLADKRDGGSAPAH